MSNIVVYSCVTGAYDMINSTLISSIGVHEPNVRYVLYTDQVKKIKTVNNPKSKISWEFRPLVWQHPLCQRRTARWHKINNHLLPDDADYTVWVDGSQQIKEVGIFSKLVEPISGRYMLGTFKHPNRTCVYQELQACINRKKDNFQLMRNQIKKYREDNYPPYNGMVETSCVFRKACPEVTAFNALWWEQISNNSFRDQLSFNYAAWKLNQPYGIIPGCRSDSRFFRFIPHKYK